MPDLPLDLPGAVLFDLDGTLVDSAPDICAALNRVLGEADRRPIDVAETKRMIGDSTAKLVERAFAATGDVPEEAVLADHRTRYLAIYHEVLADTSRPYPGVAETLAGLQAAGVAMAVCSNKFVAPTRQMLDVLGLAQFFGAVVGGDSLAVRKPDPAHLHAALDTLGVAAADAAMVGDNEHDVAAARGAGLPVVVMAYGYARVRVDELGADAILTDFAELPRTLHRIRGRLKQPLS